MKNIYTILGILAVVTVLGGSIASIYSLKHTAANEEQNVGASVPLTPALIDTYLASGINNNETSMTLADGTTRAGTTLSGYMCFTIDVNTPTVEYVCGTASGTSITALARGVDVLNPNTTSSALAFPHRRFASVQISDYPTLQIMVRKMNGTDTLDNFLSYTTSTAIPTANGQLANKYYVDSVGAGGFTCANVSTTLGLQCTGSVPEKAGINASSTQFGFDGSGRLYAILQSLKGLASDASGFFIKIGSTLLFDGSGNLGVNASTTPVTSTIPLSSTSTADVNRWVNGFERTYTAGEAINASATPTAVYLSSIDGKVYKASSNFTSSTFRFIGFVAKSQNVTTSDNVWVTEGEGAIVSGFTGLTTGDDLYISTTGTIANSAGTVPWKIARAVSTTAIMIAPAPRKYVGTYSNNLQSSAAASVTTTINIGFKAKKITIIGSAGERDDSTILSKFYLDNNNPDAGNNPFWYEGTTYGYDLDITNSTLGDSSTYLLDVIQTNVYSRIYVQTVTQNSTTFVWEYKTTSNGNTNDQAWINYLYIIEE